MNLRKYLIATFVAAPALAYAQAPVVSPTDPTLYGLERQGYAIFEPLSAPLILEARTGTPANLDAVLTGPVRDSFPADAQPYLNGFSTADEFARHRTIEALTPFLTTLRSNLANSKGVLMRLAESNPIRLHEYDFNAHQFVFDVSPTYAVQRYFPGGLFCSGVVDRQTKFTSRTFCVYPTNWGPQGQFTFNDQKFAEYFKHALTTGTSQLYMLAAYDGPVRPAISRDKIAGLQGVRVLGYYLIKRDFTAAIETSIEYQDNGPLGPLYQQAALNNKIAAKEAPLGTRQSSQLPELKEVPRLGTTTATTKANGPVVIDLK